MAPEPYNLHCEGRMGHPFRPPGGAVISDKPLNLTYHHIVPYSKLIDFWNRLVGRGDIKNCEFLPPIWDMIKKGAYVDILHVAERALPGARERDLEAVRELAMKIYKGEVFHDQRGGRHGAWDNLMTVYGWLPGNIFVGPTERSDDPGDSLDEAAFRIMGARQVRRRIVSAANSEILSYTEGPPGRKSKSASEALGKVVRYARIQDFDGRGWEWNEDKTRLRAK